MDRLYTLLQNRIEGVVSTPDQYHAGLLSNFGNLFHATPRLVVSPLTARDVAATVTFAREHGLTVSTRGAAHSQSRVAISDGGILLSMSSMRRILSVDASAPSVDVEAGVVWRDLVRHLAPRNLAPPVLTNNLSVTVGGTLAIAGIGVSSFKYGTQGDNVRELEVVAGTGERLVCDRKKHADLFWGSLAGLGQAGIITRARLDLRATKPMTRTYYLLYRGLRGFLHDAKLAMERGRWDHLESWASPSPQGTKPVAGRRQVFARWFYPFHLTVEFDPGHPPDDEELLRGLDPFERLYVDDLPTVDFFERMIPVFDLWKQGGTWKHIHAWIETVLPWEHAVDCIESVLPDLPPSILVGGHVLLWPAKGTTSKVPFFMRPPGEDLIGFGVLPAIPARFWERARPMLENLSRMTELMGGKRYLSGYLDWTEDRWKNHFGDQWGPFTALKHKYDPHSILNPGFVPFPAAPADVRRVPGESVPAAD
ncbi:MAG: FAD-binding protein [Candidatus Eisenbacteria bacterium]|uniref:FAD-binding protein n=1 Tax=Eiseniibacteriota bacterium TaxID=2212470 RepID=A0A538TC72_UNCEI|nr:MAG: FAD-binding protein [Candidatus Eisenbacteria bacterium]